MSLSPAPFGTPMTTDHGFTARAWQIWLQNLRNLMGVKPFPLASYTVATLPAAASYTNHTVYVSDETGGGTIAFSDGTDWRRVQDRAIVS